MKEFKGTKGDWECVDMDDDSISEISATMVVCGDVVLAVVGPTADSSLPEDEHNANLIAAAPDLLEALQDLYISLFNSDQWSKQQLNSFSKARSAIAKALGETK